MATEENINQTEVLEESEQEELVEAPEQEQPEVELSEKSKAKVKEDDDEDEEGEDEEGEEEEEDEQVKKEEFKVPTTKSAMIKQLFDKVNGMKKEEVSAKWKDLMGVAEATADDLGGAEPHDSSPEGDADAVGKKKKKMKVKN